jgi:hypothetical protein
MPLSVTDDTAFAVGVGGGLNFRAKLTSSTYSTYAGIWSYRESALNSDYAGSLIFGTSDNSNGYPIERFRISSSGVATWSVGGSTAMTLNSTGLGVGTTDTTNGRLSIRAGTAATGNSLFLQNLDGTYNPYLQIQHSSSGIKLYTSSSFGGDAGNLTIGCGGATNALIVNGSGNVGVGVTPSAWGSSLKAFELGAKGNALFTTASVVDGLFMVNNAYFDTGYKYAANGYASRYTQYQAAHQWFNAPTGTAGNAITFTQAMSLDASGNLLVGKSSAVATAVGIQFQPLGTSYHTLSASTNSDSTLLVYSTGAAAFRFYVGLAGTVFATNTTISAISDARLKENVQDLDVGLDAILALKPRKFDWKAGKGKDIKGDRGFIAQEFETVFPQLVDEWADPAPEGEAPYKSVRQDLIPVLVKAIQELTARVQTLEAK